MPRRSALPLVMALVVGIALVLGVRWWFAAPEAAPPGDCVPLNVTASSEKAALLTALATRYNAAGRQVDGRCVTAAVHELPSGAAADALATGWDEAADGPRPDVWTPAARSWATLVAHRLQTAGRPTLIPDDQPSVAQSPLVIAMPRPMAEALGWPQRSIGWDDLSDLARDPKGWGARGHPEWGPFRLGKTNPNFSTSGLNATVAAFFDATGGSTTTGLTVADVDSPAARTEVRGVEGSVLHYGDTTLTYLENLYNEDRQGRALRYVSAVAVEEKSVWDYNQGNPSGDPGTVGNRPPPGTELVAVYPRDGTLVSDNPFLTLTAPWVGDTQRAAAADLLAFLREPAQQEQFQQAAFRGFDGTPGPVLARSTATPNTPFTVLAPPPGPVLERMVQAWSELQKRANLIIVMDVSGSMNLPVDGTDRTRWQLAKTAAEQSLTLLGPDDLVSLWSFSTPLNGEPTPYRVLVPSGPLSQVRGDLQRTLDQLAPDRGDTALYTTTRAAVAAVQAAFDPDRINAVVLLSDGRNEYPPDDDLDGLLRGLDEQRPDRTVRVFTVAYGPQADLAVLTQISTASTAAAYDARQPTTIDSVMTNVVSNF